MEVELISYTHGAAEVCAMAANSCYSEHPAHEIDLTEKKIKSILNKTIKSGHHSVLEHAVYTFSISGVSRVLTHQLVRHRLASYSQQSQRYVKLDKVEFVIPYSCKGSKDNFEKNEHVFYANGIFEKAMKTAFEVYNELLDNGIPEEDARYVLPNACCTNITVTMNARELLHFFELRLCNKAQWEIRELAEKMLKLCMDVEPDIFEYAGAPCEHEGCRELTACDTPKG